MARKTGETAPAGTGTVLYPCAREGGALSDLCANKEAEGPCTLCFCADAAMSTKKNPASEEAGSVDVLGSVAVAARPDQDEAVVAIPLHQRGVDRGREARIVELDREIFAIAVPRGLLPGGAELGGAGEDAIVGRLVVILIGRDKLRLDVERERLDRSGEAVLGQPSTVLLKRSVGVCFAI